MQVKVNTMSNLLMIGGLVYLGVSLLVGLIAYCVCSMAGRSAQIGRLERMLPQQPTQLAEKQQSTALAPSVLSNQPAR